MAKLMAKCPYCGISFDRNQEEWVAVNSRRYAHKSCHDRAQAGKTQDEKDYELLLSCIKKIFGYTTIPAKVTRQIADYKKEYNFSYSGMHKALTWWFEVKGNSVEAANGGIGILPYIYNDARTYYFGLYMAQLSNQNRTVRQDVEVVEIPSPRVYVQPPKLFDIGEEENES